MAMEFGEALMALVERRKAAALAQTDILSLGELIARLEAQPPANTVKVAWFDQLANPGDVGSYRGYYSDLYIDHGEPDERDVSSLLANLRAAIGSTFFGYKGGDFTMSRATPVWVDVYGSASGIGATGVESRGDLTVITSASCDSY